MSHHDEEQLPSIDLDTLDAVTGGVASSSSNAQVADALKGIQSSLSNLGQSNNNSSSAFTQMLPLLMFAQGGGGGGAGGACPCGCGMANCMRR